MGRGPANLDERTRLGLDNELEDLVENWMEADHDAQNPLRTARPFMSPAAISSSARVAACSAASLP